LLICWTAAKQGKLQPKTKTTVQEQIIEYINDMKDEEEH
jgi:hypothetical protein